MGKFGINLLKENGEPGLWLKQFGNWGPRRYAKTWKTKRGPSATIERLKTDFPSMADRFVVMDMDIVESETSVDSNMSDKASTTAATAFKSEMNPNAHENDERAVTGPSFSKLVSTSTRTFWLDVDKLKTTIVVGPASIVVVLTSFPDSVTTIHTLAGFGRHGDGTTTARYNYSIDGHGTGGNGEVIRHDFVRGIIQDFVGRIKHWARGETENTGRAIGVPNWLSIQNAITSMAGVLIWQYGTNVETKTRIAFSNDAPAIVGELVKHYMGEPDSHAPGNKWEYFRAFHADTLAEVNRIDGVRVIFPVTWLDNHKTPEFVVY